MSCKTYDPCLNGKLNQIGSYASVARQSAEASQASATQSAASASASAASAASAAESAAEAAASAEIAGIYLGAFAVAPVPPIEEGALYFNTVDNTMYVWDGTSWITATGFNETTNFLATGTTTARDLQERFADVVNVKDFGAVGDGVADDTAAIQAAIDAQSTNGTIWFPQGNYLLTSSLVVNTFGLTLLGSKAELRANHTNGPVIRIKRESVTLERLSFIAVGARASSSASGNYGIHIEADEITPQLVRHVLVKQCIVRFQPSEGILLTAAGGPNVIELCDIKDNKGHGIAIDNGTISGRNPAVSATLTTINNCTVFNNDGHGLFAGTQNENGNRTVRLLMRNTELGRNAQSSGIRKSAHQAHLFGSQIIVEGCAFQGADKAKTVATTGGVFVAGNGIFLTGNRFLDVANEAVEIGNFSEFPTKGCWIKDVQLSSEVGQPILDPVIKIASAAQRVFVENGSDFSMGSLVTESYRITRSAPIAIVKAQSQAVANSTTLVNDSTLTVPVRPNQRSKFECSLFYSGPSAAGIKITFVGPAGSTVAFGPASGTIVDTSDSVVVQPSVAGGSTISLGTSISDRRSINLLGYIDTDATGGNLTLQFAQNTANAANTFINSESSLVFYASM